MSRPSLIRTEATASGGATRCATASSTYETILKGRRTSKRRRRWTRREAEWIAVPVSDSLEYGLELGRSLPQGGYQEQRATVVCGRKVLGALREALYCACCGRRIHPADGRRAPGEQAHLLLLLPVWSRRGRCEIPTRIEPRRLKPEVWQPSAWSLNDPDQLGADLDKHDRDWGRSIMNGDPGRESKRRD